MRKLIVGSRESLLAVAQTMEVVEKINQMKKDVHATILTMKTTGDKILNKTLAKIGGKGLFVKELDLALLDGRSDLSVHSMKDLPAETDERISILGYMESEDFRDVLVFPAGKEIPELSNPNLSWEEVRTLILEKMDVSKPVGTASPRREKQFQRLFPELEVKAVRGNVNTRLKKLDEGEYSVLILAAAGLKRLHLEQRIGYYFALEQMIPAIGQGVIVVQGRRGEDYGDLDQIFSESARKRVVCERAFVKCLKGGCSTPAGIYAEQIEEGMHLYGYYYNEETKKQSRKELIINGLDEESLIQGGEKLAKELLLETSNDDRR